MKKKKKKKGEAIERESIERWILTSRNCLNVCSVKIDVDAAIFSPLLLNQRLTYGRLVSPLNYIRIRVCYPGLDCQPRIIVPRGCRGR